MKVILYPGKEEYQDLLMRPHKDAADLGATVASVLNDVRLEGDKAVLRYEAMFDKVELASLAVTEEEILEAEAQVADELKELQEISRHLSDIDPMKTILNTIVETYK